MTEENEARGLKIDRATVSDVDVSGIRFDGDDANGFKGFKELEKRVAVLEKRAAREERRLPKKADKPLHLGVKTIPPPQFRPLKKFDLPVSE